MVVVVGRECGVKRGKEREKLAVVERERERGVRERKKKRNKKKGAMRVLNEGDRERKRELSGLGTVGFGKVG